ncbi:hypothetical protein DTO271G3_2548 [Paecilomyces variotii]|nr:hypothetical protein DTO271G3_2548 [Paecilomyces variotii]
MAIQKEQQTAVKDEKPEGYRHNEHTQAMVGKIDSYSADRMSLDKPDVVHVDKLDGDLGRSAWESDETSIDSLPASKFVWLVALTVSIAGSLFGYHLGIISPVLVCLGDDLNNRFLSSDEKELITSLSSGGAFVGAIIACLTADRYGRKVAIYIDCSLFTIGAILQAASYTITQLYVGCLVIVLGLGSAATIVPLYIAEIAPTKVRGRLIGLNNMSITGGQVVSYAIGAAFANVTHGWRYMAGLAVVPAITLAFLMPFCPESPRHLIYHGKVDQARVVLQKIYKGATDEQVASNVTSIMIACNEAKEVYEGERQWSKIKQMYTNPANLRALLSATGLMVISQLSGFRTLVHCSGALFALVGFNNLVAVGIVVAGVDFVMTWVNMVIVDRVGRRRIMICTVWAMCASLIAIAIAFLYIPINRDTLAVESTKSPPAAIVVLVFIILFVMLYGVSAGSIAWMSTDFFPLEVRAMGTMWIACFFWGSNAIISGTFLSMMKDWTPSGTFGFYAGICGVGWILIIFFYPEVSGLTLEEIKEVFNHGFGVRYASKLRKERKEIVKERLKNNKTVAVAH